MNKKEIKLAFLGNMNNFPFNNARKLKERGWNITFYVDVSKNFLLDRPESILKISELPAWVNELNIEHHQRKQFIKMLLPRLTYSRTIRLLNQYDVVFLNGEWIKLAPYIKSEKLVMGLFAGIDLESADYDKIEEYATASVKNKKTLVPKALYKILWRRLISAQIKGVRRVDTVNYYLPGVNPQGERVLETQKKGKKYFRLPLRGVETSDFPYIAHTDMNGKFIILNTTRFNFTVQRNDNKRNDLMIEGIAQFIKKNNLSNEQVECVFFAKGNLQEARELCTARGLDPYITWQEQVPVADLKQFMARCHVSFDQLGEQWIGAGGIYSMLIGRPVVCNYRPELFDEFLKVKAPICQAVNADDVADWLTQLYHNRQKVHDIGIASRNFILDYMNIERDVDFYENVLKQIFHIPD